MEDNFTNTAVFCKECGHQLNPGDKFCRDCGSTQMQEVNMEPVNVEKKMRLRAAELLPCLKLPAGYMPLMSDGLPARGGMPDPREMQNPDYQPPLFRPMIKDLSENMTSRWKSVLRKSMCSIYVVLIMLRLMTIKKR